MANPKEELLDLLVKSGVSRQEAQPAVNRCLLQMGATAVASYGAGGLLVYFLAMNPITAPGFVTVTTAAGGAYALGKSPQCQDVRRAIRFWVFGS